MPHEWGLGWKHHGDKRHRSWVEFKALFYNDGDPVYRHPQISKQPVEGEGWSREYYTGELGVDEEVTVTMELETSEASSYEADVSFTITNRISAEVHAGGDIAGGSASTSTETQFSSSFGLNSSEGTNKTVSSSEKTTVHVPPDFRGRLVCDKVRTTEVREVLENAYLDFQFDFKIYHWATKNQPYLRDGEGYEPLHFDNGADFIEFLEGRHPAEHPNMNQWLPTMQAQAAGRVEGAKAALAAYDFFATRDNFKVSVKRRDTRVEDNAGQIRTEKD